MYKFFGIISREIIAEFDKLQSKRVESEQQKQEEVTA